jgi:hypothetical protein
MEGLIAKAGLNLRQIRPISELGVRLAGGDVERQHLCVFSR